MKINTVVRYGAATLVMGALFAVGLPVQAGNVVWVRAEKLDYFRARGLVPPGFYSPQDNSKPATMAVNKAGQGVGERQPAAPKATRNNPQRVCPAKKHS
jgi:hypothetical protein